VPETADFTLRLHDEVNRPARSAAAAMRQLAGAFSGSQREIARTEGALASHFRRQSTLAERRTVAFHGAAIRQHAAESFARRQAQIQQAGGLSRLADLEGTSVGALGLGTGTAAGLGAVTMVGAAAATAAVGVGILASKFALATGAAVNFTQSALIGLTSIMRSASEARTQFNAVRLEASSLGLDVRGAVDSFKALKNAGFETSQARELVRMSADLTALTGSAESASFALRAITQIKMKGRLQAEEITGQLAEHGISADEVYRVLGKTLGKTRDEILKMQKAGEVSADVAIPAILQAVRNQLGVDKSGGFAQKVVAGTLSGLGRKMAGAWDNAMLSLGERVRPSFERVSVRVDGLIDRLANSPALARFADRYAAAIEGAARFIEKNWSSIEKTIVGGAEAMADAVGSAIDFTREHWDDITTVMKGAGVALVAIAAAAAVASVGVLTLTAPVIMLAGAVAYLTGKLIEGSAELGRWLKLAGAAAMLVPGGGGFGLALQGLGNIADRGGTLLTLEDEIRNESRARTAGNAAAAGQAGRLFGGASAPATDNSRRIGSITVPTQFSALDPEDTDGIMSKWEGMVRRSVNRILEET
jgi:tape measure domain-containing protein